MSALPKITPRATPLPPSSAGPVKPLSAAMPTVYQVYPPRLPSAPNFPPGRINPLRPTLPLKRTVMLETKGTHHLNEQRSLAMKEREHYRYHNAWSKYYYGDPVQQETYRSYIRTVLKKQMEDADTSARFHFEEKVKESADASDKDKQARFEDATDFFKKYQYLKSFRDENKSLMETAWADRRRRKYQEDVFDREQLKYNPINWSCTLK